MAGVRGSGGRAPGKQQGFFSFGCGRPFSAPAPGRAPRRSPTVPRDGRARRERAAPQGCVNARYAAERDERTATARVGWCLSLVLFHKGFYH
jgi:hypothetical protein